MYNAPILVQEIQPRPQLSSFLVGVLYRKTTCPIEAVGKDEGQSRSVAFYQDTTEYSMVSMFIEEPTMVSKKHTYTY